ncbi:MAG: YggT family protein [Alphaproteobacteria bacterium]|nr:YggT family protein [Alphaproteobacteria bacterium]
MGAIFEPFLYVIGLLVDIYFKIVVVQIVLYWLIHFKVLEPSNKYAQKTVELLDKVTLPVYKKIGEKIPPLSGFDFSPFILILVLIFVSRLIMRLSALMM